MSSLLRRSRGLMYNINSDENSYITEDDLKTKKPKEEVLPYLQDRPSFNSEKHNKKSQLSEVLQLGISDDVLNMAQSSTENHSRPKKRSYPKAGPKCCKKKAADSYFVEDNSLDNDLLGLVGSLDTGKNLDSDSSTDTIIIDDTIIINDSNSSFDAQHVTHVDNANTFCERTTNNKVFEVSDGYSLTQLQSVENGKPINNLHLTSVKKETKENIKTPEPKSKASLLREVLSATSPSRTPSLSATPSSRIPSLSATPSSRIPSLSATPSSRIPSLSATPSIPIPFPNSLQTKGNKSPFFNRETKTTSIKTVTEAPERKMLVQNTINNTNSFSSNLSKSNKASSYQSVYASMGLDDDLCDTQPSSSVVPKSTPKETENPSNIQIKTEIEDTSFIESKSIKKLVDSKTERLAADGLHVSMTFEAEPSCEDLDDGEDDLPLLLLKNKKVDNCSTEIQSHPSNVNSITKLKPSAINSIICDDVSDFHPDPSFFIKKELIEDEIVSESQAISSKNLPLSMVKYNASNNLLPVKVKSEPVDSECSESIMKSDTNSIKKQMSSVVGLSTNLPKGKKKKNISRSEANYSPAELPTFSPTQNSEFEHESRNPDSYVSALGINASSTQINEQNILYKSHAMNKISPSESSSSKEKNNKTAKVKPKIDQTVLDRYDQTISDVIFSSLSETINEDLPTTEDNVIDSNASVAELENEVNTKKRKRKNGDNKDAIDENIPITLLIKKKKTDSNDINAPDSFLCTSITTTKIPPKDLSLPHNCQDNASELLDKESFFLDDTDNSCLPLKTPPKQKVKKKRKGRKKQTKKKNQKKVIVNADNNDILQSDLNIQPSVNNLTTHSEVFESAENNSYEVDSNLSENSAQNPDIEKYDDLSFVSPVQKEKYLSTDSQDLQESISVTSSQASNLDDISSRSELSNFEPGLELDVNTPKKKKRRVKSNNWYKKKKSRAKKPSKGQFIENTSFDIASVGSTAEETSSTYQTLEKVSSSCNPSDNINSLILTTKQPIVVINKVPSDIHVAHNSEETIDATPSNLTEVAPLTNNKKRKTRPQRKGKISSAKSNNSSLAEESLLNDSIEPETVEANGNLLQNDQQIPNTSNSVIVSDIDRFCNEEFAALKQIEKSGNNASKDNSGSSLAVGQRAHLFQPTLNVQEIAKEIAEYEALIESRVSESSNSTLQNILRSNSGNDAVQKQNVFQPQTFTNDANENSLTFSSPNSQSSSLVSNNSDYVQLLRNVEIKKELDDSFCKSSVNQPKQMTLPNKESLSNTNSAKAGGISDMINLALSKNARNLEKNSSDKSSVTQHSNKSTCSFNAANPQMLIVNSATPNQTLTNNSTRTPQCYIPQNSLNVDINSIGLSIKKEVCDATKSTSSNCNYTIKDQNDLIDVAHQLNSRTSTALSKGPIDATSEKTSALDENRNVASHPEKSSLESFSDDEIEILPPENSERNVLCMDLTNEHNQPDLVCSTQQKSSEYNTISSLSGDVIEWSKKIKIENTDPKSNSDCLLNKPVDIQTSIPDQQSSTFSFPRCNIVSNQLDSSKIKTNVSASGFIKDDGKYTNVDPITRETGNAFIVRDKYLDEYFKHPFPPSLVLYNKKQRTKNKMYTRIDSKTWNLTLEEVEYRLKQSETVMPQFGKKLGDIVKLEKYAVSLCEAECYHRILGIAPSQKLKCFLSPKKMNTIINSEFNKPYEEELNKFENKESNPMNCTIDDILQGITETKMMYSSNISDNDSVLFDRNCASVDTTDSFDSCVSHLTDKMLGVASNKDIKNSKTFPGKETELDSVSREVFSSDQSSLLTSTNMPHIHDRFKNVTSSISIEGNSLLSSTAPNAQDSLKNAVSDVDISKIKETDSSISHNLGSSVNDLYLQNNALSSLKLPNQETINNILSISEASQSAGISTSSLTSSCPATQTTCVDTSVVASNYISSQTTSVNTPLISSACAEETKITAVCNKSSSETENTKLSVETDLVAKVNATESQSVLNKPFGVLDLPITELRKILETAGSLQSDSVNSDDGGMWKNKATYEYNHTQSIPVTDKNLENEPLKNVYSAASEPIQPAENDDSDDGYVDNEPVPYVSDNERDDSSSPEKEEEPPPIPQYKSKWEKIMERKSQELKEKQGVNELFLKDCIPVSSRFKTQSKKNNTLNKDPTPSADKVASKSKEGESKDKSKKSSESTKSKSSKSKKKAETAAEKKAKSNKTSKKAEKQDNKNTESKNSKKELPSKKTKDKKAENVSHLFAPDKLVKTPSAKKPSPVTSEENSKSKRFYGNRVTNRGSFLTETSPSKLKMKMPKIPKKKVPESANKFNVHSEEFHSMIKSPDINIGSSYRPSFKNGNKFDSRKNTDYKSPLSNTSQHKTSHFIRTKRMRDRQLSFSHPHHFDKSNESKQRNAPLYDHFGDNNMVNKKSPLLDTPVNEEGMLHRKGALLNTPLNEEFLLNKNRPLFPAPPASQNNDGQLNIKNSLFDMHSVIPNCFNNEANIPVNAANQNIPVIIGRQTSISSKVPPDSLQPNAEPTSTILKQIMSQFKPAPNPVPEVKDGINPLFTALGSNWNGNQFGSTFNDQSLKQNISQLLNFSLDSKNSSNNLRSTSITGSLDPRRAALGLQSNNVNVPVNLASGLQSNNITVPLNSALRLQSNNITVPLNSALGLQSNNITVPLNSALGMHNNNINVPLKSALGMQSNNINVPINPAFGNIPASVTLNPQRTSLPLHAVSTSKNKLDSPLDSSSLLFNSPPCTMSFNQPSSQTSRKATCLVPPHLKSLVGHKTIQTDDVRLLMLEWSVDWLNQQQQLSNPPPVSNTFSKVVSSYENIEDYYNTYFPLMLLETWQRIYVSWMHLNQTAPYICQITSYSVKNHYVSVECQTVFSTDVRPKGVFPDEGSILLIKYCTKSNDYAIKIFGYVTHVKTRRYNPVTDSKICSSLQKDADPDCLQILTLTFMGAYNSEDIDKRQPVRIHVLCNVKHTLKQNDALLYMNKSPLQRSILNPVADGLLTLTLTSRNSPEDKVNECVRDITKGILSPHPLPLLTVVRATPESDRLNIIPLLIQKMKSAYRTKVLLCVRTVRALGDIAANICLQPSLKLVIINKRCDTNPQFQKFLLDELVSNEIKNMEDDKSVEKINLKNEASIKIKKQILKDCDVVLSLIRNSHDDFMCETFVETESIAQMCCIVDEANLCTEPETLIPILHGISKLILIGDPDYTAKVLSKKAVEYVYNQSFFQRAYDLDLLTE